MDACIHDWFGGSKSSLHARIDNSTGRLVSLFFDNQETLN